MKQHTRARARVRAPVAALTAVLMAGLVAGCGATTPVMVGHGNNAGARAGHAPGPGSMMSSVPHGYHLHRHMQGLTCSAPSLPGTQVFVMLGDMGKMRTTAGMVRGTARLGVQMMLRAMPARVRAGQVSFVVANVGGRNHEMVVLPLADGQRAGQRPAGADGRVEENGSLGEASASCAAGSGEGIKAGAVGWVTLHLPAGRYELVCDLPNHYADGMRRLLVVS